MSLYGVIGYHVTLPDPLKPRCCRNSRLVVDEDDNSNSRLVVDWDGVKWVAYERNIYCYYLTVP